MSAQAKLLLRWLTARGGLGRSPAVLAIAASDKLAIETLNRRRPASQALDVS